jgi:glycosyltransferase involved in cell wall biosynthesis
MKQIRILYIHGGVMKSGGTESYMMNYYRNIDRTKIQIDFIVHGFEKGVYDDEIEKLGGRIYHVPVKSKNLLGNYIAIKKIMKSGKYKIVHSHMDAMSYVPLKIARKYEVPIRIAHSHNNSYLTSNPIKIKINDYAKKRLPNEATLLFACSKLAGEWLYGKDNMDRVELIPNAIDVERFSFNSETRRQIRQELNLNNDDVVIGHIGRFEYQKNHDYLIQIFERLHKTSDKYKLILIGDGSMKEAIKQKCEQKGLSKYMIFLNSRKDVCKYYNAFDLFCMPSHFEGLSVVMIEAQTNGLKCITSDTVSKEVNITGNVSFIPIKNENLDMWVRAIFASDIARDINALEKVVKAGYSIKEAATELEKKYKEMVE